MRALQVPKIEADGVKDRLNRRHSLNLNWRPGRKGDMVLLPLLGENPFPQYPVVEAELEPQDRHRPPQERIAERLDLSPMLKAQLPEKYERLGHVLVLRLPDDLIPYKEKVAEAYAKVLRARTVLLEKGIIRGVERRPDVELHLRKRDGDHPSGIRDPVPPGPHEGDVLLGQLRREAAHGRPGLPRGDGGGHVRRHRLLHPASNRKGRGGEGSSMRDQSGGRGISSHQRPG